MSHETEMLDKLTAIEKYMAVHAEQHKGIDARIKGLVDVAEKHNDVLYGNGRAGLVTKVRIICWSLGLSGLLVGGAGGHICTKIFGG